jgi:aspartyl/asparaginyl beta-hydroxylase (cupin superfamily)
VLPGREYLTCEVTDFWEPCSRAFFIKVPPHAQIHRHSDEAIKGVTHHLVLETNPKCLNWWIEDGEERSCHLETGGRYIVQREPVHWATNDGETDRIHLLVEYEALPRNH